jgi:hypothetical protein
MVQAPSCSPRYWCIADRAEPALLIPDVAKCTSAPKCFPHVISFAILEVGFKGRVVGISFAFNLDVSLDGSAFGEVQPDYVWLPLIITGFAKGAALLDFLISVKFRASSLVRAVTTVLFS